MVMVVVLVCFNNKFMPSIQVHLFSKNKPLNFFKGKNHDLKLSYQHQLILKHLNHMQMRICHRSEVIQHQAINENKQAQ